MDIRRSPADCLTPEGFPPFCTRYGIYVPIGIDPLSHTEKVKLLISKLNELNEINRFKIDVIDFCAWKLDSASIAKQLTDPERYELK